MAFWAWAWAWPWSSGVFGERVDGVPVCWLCSSGRFGIGGKNAACPLSSAWLFGGGAKAPVVLAETGETVLTRPGMAPTLSVLGDGLGGRGEATESLANSALPPYGPRGTGGSFALSGIRNESGRFLLALRTKKMMAPITARPPMTPTTAPTMTPVLLPLELSLSPPWDEPSDPSLPEFPLPSSLLSLLPPFPVCFGPLVVARVAGYVCSIELETPAAVTFASAALQ